MTKHIYNLLKNDNAIVQSISRISISGSFGRIN